MPSTEISRQRERSETRPLYSTHQSTLSLEELTDIFAARPDRDDAIPTIEPLWLRIGSLNRSDFDGTPIVETAPCQRLEFRLVQVAANTN